MEYGRKVMSIMTKFLDPKNDLVFKRIFGTEKNKDILIHFLNDIFERQDNPIVDVTFLKTVQEIMEDTGLSQGTISALWLTPQNP